MNSTLSFCVSDIFSGMSYYFFLIFRMNLKFNKHKIDWAYFFYEKKSVV